MNEWMKTASRIVISQDDDTGKNEKKKPNLSLVLVPAIIIVLLSIYSRVLGFHTVYMYRCRSIENLRS